MTETCTCPVCGGTGRQKVEEPFAVNTRHYNNTWDVKTDTIACRNCGGQTMGGRPTGQSRLRPNGAPCRHEFAGRLAGNCYYVYTCTHCGYSYDIDSGD